MGAKRLNPRLAKVHYSYTVGEAALLFGVHRNTVRGWLKGGLARIGCGKPCLIHGAELRRFLITRRQSARRPCGQGNLYCLRCRSPRPPAGHMADFTPFGPTTGNLSAICPECGRMMFRRIRADQVRAVFPETDVQFTQAESRLKRTSAASPDCHLKATEKA